MCIHSPELALEYCDNILLMKSGTILSTLIHIQTLLILLMKRCLLYMIILMSLNVLTLTIKHTV